MRLTWCSLALAVATIYSIPVAKAQSAFDLNIGFGSAHVGSNGAGIDNANSVNAFGSCILNTGDPNCQATPSLGGFFLGFGGDLMLTKRYGFGAEFNVKPGKSDYGPLQYRELFYDFNGIVAPVNLKRVVVELQGGIGGARTSFSFTQNACVGTAVCSTQSEPVGNASHFQLHVGVGVQLFVTQHIFIRPQFDYRYVPGLTDQFGSNSVTAGMVWVGYNWGDR
ncbi:MAG: outer membrane beta-barrel protein [Acidobacteriia bacterium]|nr:outer membrane beta-barrel protein [Terriglobia bacterium]